MANIFIFFYLARYWNKAASIIASFRGFSSNLLALDATDVDKKASNEAFDCFCDTTYLSGGFLSKKASLLTHQYSCALNSIYSNNSDSFFAQKRFFENFLF